ncbi:YdgA family protein [Legionella lytica]|uniref:YdgA family protein n=1 Tax=Legionella lytica TaxID=96232 RepID=A0ABY4Y7H2_9GAMM|nr:YdgA family protein [Legionella lytica]USQ13328.1 YdgA family protein [Legionella lytica]
MKKWIGLFSLVVIVLIAYYVMGNMAKTTLTRNIDSFPKSSVITLHLDQYQQGWFSSKALLDVKMHIPAQKITDTNGIAKMDTPLDLDISIPIHIKHGPFIWTDNGFRFGIAEVATRPETHYKALINYLRETVIKYSLPSFDLKGNDGTADGAVQINWKGLTTVLGVSSNLDKINANFSLYGLSGSASNIEFNFSELEHDVQLWRHQEWLWLGQSHLGLTSATINAPDEQHFQLQGLDLRFNSDVTENKMGIDCKLSLEKLVVDNQNYGPGVFKLSIKNLDPNVMAKLNQQEANMVENNVDPNLAMLAIAAELPKLLTKGPVIELAEMNLTLPEGQINGNFKIWLPENEAKDASQAMQKVRGEGHFKAPIRLVKSLIVASIKSDLTKKVQQQQPASVTNPIAAFPAPVNPDAEAQKQAEQLVADLTNKGFLKVDGDNYVVDFTLENQKLQINGKPVNL